MAGIGASNQIIGRQGIFAVPAAVADESTLWKVLRTGIWPANTTNAIPIPEAATALFRRPIPIGSYSLWKYWEGDVLRRTRRHQHNNRSLHGVLFFCGTVALDLRT